MPLELDRPNEEFAARIAELIATKGHTIAQYEDKSTGACCVLGGLRIAVFGTVFIFDKTPDPEKMRRYWELVRWLADQVRYELERRPKSNEPELIVGCWNDFTRTDRVLERLREIGRGENVLDVPQA